MDHQKVVDQQRTVHPHLLEAYSPSPSIPQSAPCQMLQGYKEPGPVTTKTTKNTKEKTIESEIFTLVYHQNIHHNSKITRNEVKTTKAKFTCPMKVQAWRPGNFSNGNNFMHCLILQDVIEFTVTVLTMILAMYWQCKVIVVWQLCDPSFCFLLIELQQKINSWMNRQKNMDNSMDEIMVLI